MKRLVWAMISAGAVGLLALQATRAIAEGAQTQPATQMAQSGQAVIAQAGPAEPPKPAKTVTLLYKADGTMLLEKTKVAAKDLAEAIKKLAPKGGKPSDILVDIKFEAPQKTTWEQLLPAVKAIYDAGVSHFNIMGAAEHLPAPGPTGADDMSRLALGPSLIILPGQKDLERLSAVLAKEAHEAVLTLEPTAKTTVAFLVDVLKAAERHKAAVGFSPACRLGGEEQIRCQVAYLE